MIKDKNGRNLSLDEALPKINKRMIAVLLEFQLMLLRWTGCIPSHSWRSLVYRLAGIKIGKGSVIHMWANFYPTLLHRFLFITPNMIFMMKVLR